MSRHLNRATSRAGKLRALFLAGLLALAASVATALPAAAHNVLESTTPKDGSTVPRVPSEVVLTFDEPAIAMGTQVIVRGPGGNVAAGPAQLVDNTVRQTIGTAPAGRYTVDWRVTSADGHPVSGTFAFTASAAGGSSGAISASPVPTPSGSGPFGGSGALLVIIAVLVVAGVVTAVVLIRRRR